MTPARFFNSPTVTAFLTILTSPEIPWLLSSTDSVGLVASRTYDAGGNVLTASNGEGEAMTNVYDALGRLSTATNALTQTTTYTYDSVGNVLTVTDAENHVRQTAYDDVNRVALTTDPLNETVGYAYDLGGRLTTMTASNDTEPSQVTEYAYDAAGRRTSETYPDDEGANPPNVRSFTYDDVGNVASRTDQNGDQTFYTYDDLHRLVGRSYVISASSDSWPPVQGPDSFTYDRAGHLLTADRPYGGATPDATTGHCWLLRGAGQGVATCFSAAWRERSSGVWGLAL